MNVIDSSARPRLGRGFRLQWEPAQSAHVLLYPEGMVKLNGSAAAIMTRCDGERTITDIAADLERTYGRSGLAEDVRAFVALALDRKWLEIEE